MPRLAATSPEALLKRATARFWTHGYAGSSVDDLVSATGVSRHGLYARHDGKRALFLAAIDSYVADVIDPAFVPLEAPGAGLAEIRGFFDHRLDSVALPGPGCLIVNAMAADAPHDEAVRKVVARHLGRIEAGFAHALDGEAARCGVEAFDTAGWAATLTVFAQGLWAVSRVAVDRAALRSAVKPVLDSLSAALAR